jgi:hypothetical protein
LIGQPELRELILESSMEQLRQRITASYHLGPLEAHETRAYVEHRLLHVGWKGDPAIAETAYGMIHRATGGIPRRINALCKRLLLAAYLAEEHQIGLPQVTRGIAELHSELGPDAIPDEVEGAESAPPVRATNGAAPRAGSAASSNSAAASAHGSNSGTAPGPNAGPTPGPAPGFAPGFAAAAGGGRESDAFRPFMMSAITARLDRLEQGVKTMVDMVRALGGAEEPQAAPKKSVLRPHAHAAAPRAPLARR